MDIELIPLAIEDLELVRNWRNSEEVSQYMYSDAKITSDQQINWFKKISQSENCRYWLIQYDARKVGLVSITDINHTLQSCFWAFYLGDNSIRGAGIGGKVELKIIEYVFNELGLNKLRCEVFVSNDMVIKMHEKFGFRREAYYREHCIKGDKKLDVVGLGLLKSDWLPIREFTKDKVLSK